MKHRKDITGLDLLVLPPREEAALWRRLRFERELLARERLFDRYRDVARRAAASQLRRRAKQNLERGDLEQFAYAGLLEAIDGYDPLRGAPFPPYARRRILGSIADGAARASEVGAQLSARHRVEMERLRSLDLDARKQGSAIEQLSEAATAIAIGLILDGTALIEPADGADRRPDPYESLAWREIQALIIRAVDQLPDREAIIIRQHYRHGIEFSQIARLLGLSKGRVSQLHRQALERLQHLFHSAD